MSRPAVATVIEAVEGGFEAGKPGCIPLYNVGIEEFSLVDTPEQRAVPADRGAEQAVFANRPENGIIVLLRRIISSGLLPVATPER